MEDVWDYVIRLQREAEDLGQKDTLKSVFSQIPFIACTNFFFSANSQKDISKYLYCDDTNTPPFTGGYGNTTKIWKEKHFLIKQALSILHQDKKDEIKQKHSNGNRHK